MKRYSEFINFPIYLWATKEVENEVPVDEESEADVDEDADESMLFIVNPSRAVLTLPVLFGFSFRF